MKTKKFVFRMVISSLLAAMVCVMTMVIEIPSPLHGFLNLGDCMVLLCGFLLPPYFGFLAAGIGSGLADLLAGYGPYAPATFFIKGMMALVVCGGCALLSKKLSSFWARLLSGFAAELVMVGGYYLYEGFLYGFRASLVNIPGNAVQGVVGLIAGLLLINIIEAAKLVKKLK